MNYTDDQAIQAISTVMNKTFTAEQDAILRTRGGLSIAAVAGSGKTTILTALVSKRVLTGEVPDLTKVLITTFSKAGATELEERLSPLLISLGLPTAKVTTLHATCYRILQHFGITPNIMTDGENNQLIMQAVAQALGKRVWLDIDTLEGITSMISILDNSLMSIDELMVSGKYMLDYSQKEFTDIVNAYRMGKQLAGKYTFDDLLVGVYQWLCVAQSEVVLQYCRDEFQYLFLDEFQDTNKVQFEIIKAILNLDPAARPQDRLVVVGDDDQNIYEWRGTDPRIMINIRSVVDVKKMNLSTNYRCRPNISHLAMNCVRNMGTRQEKTMFSPEGSEGGIVELLDPAVVTPSQKFNSDLVNYSQLIVDRLMEDVANGTIGQRRTCVMARTNAEMAILANMLMRNNILVYQLPSMCISRSNTWRAFKQIIQLSKPFDGNFKMQGLLWQIVPFTSAKLENIINEISNACMCSIDYAIQYLFESTCARSFARLLTNGNPAYAGRGADAINARTLASAEYQMSRLTSAEYLAEFANALRSENAKDGLLKLWCACMRDRQTRIVLAFKDYLTYVALLNEGRALDQYILYTEQVENSSNRTTHYNNIEIRTIHGSKGMEWPVVYILADDNQSFPDLAKFHTLCNTQGIKYETIKDVVDSERRLHYVAQTRAKDELYFVARRQFASVFLEETFGYEFKPSEDVYERAQMQNRGIDDENGRIIWKAENMKIDADNLPKTTSVKP